jgi:hypothetical protein
LRSRPFTALAGTRTESASRRNTGALNRWSCDIWTVVAGSHYSPWLVDRDALWTAARLRASVTSAPLVGAQQVHRLRLEGARAELMHKWRVVDAPMMTQ